MSFTLQTYMRDGDSNNFEYLQSFHGHRYEDVLALGSAGCWESHLGDFHPTDCCSYVRPLDAPLEDWIAAGGHAPHVQEILEHLANRSIWVLACY